MTEDEERIREALRGVAAGEMSMGETSDPWMPLETYVPEEWQDGYMYMGVIHHDDRDIHDYKHGITRRYLHVDRHGNFYRYTGDDYVPITREQAFDHVYEDIDKLMGKEGKASRETDYDEEYRRRRDRALAEEGWNVLGVEPGKITETEKGKRVEEQVPVKPRIDESKIEEFRQIQPMPDERYRDHEMEDKITKVVREISRDEDVPLPQLAVVPENYMIQVSEGETDLATYKPAIQRIYTSPDLTLYDLCHEMAHHREAVRREREDTVEEGVEEWRESQQKPWAERPAEKRAEHWALHCTVEYRDTWEELFGSKRFMPWQREDND